LSGVQVPEEVIAFHEGLSELYYITRSFITCAVQRIWGWWDQIWDGLGI